MTRLRHPNIDPPLVINVEDDDNVLDHIAAGWLLDEPTNHTPEPPGTDDNSPEEETE